MRQKKNRWWRVDEKDKSVRLTRKQFSGLTWNQGKDLKKEGIIKSLGGKGWCFLFLAPSLCLIAFIYAVPLFKVIYYSFAQWEGIRPTSLLGLHNYAEVLGNDNVLAATINSLLIIAFTIPITIVIAAFITHYLYKGILGWKFYRFLFYIPVIIPIAVIGVTFTFFYAPKGPLNVFLRMIGLGSITREWLGNTKTAIYAVIATAIWRDIAFAMILFYAKMMSVNPYLFESAKIDGANEMQLIRHITLPQLRGVIQLYTVLATISFLNKSFGYIFVMTGGGPGYSTTTIDYFIYLYAFKFMKFGVASTVAVLVAIMVSLLVMVYLSLSKEEEVE